MFQDLECSDLDSYQILKQVQDDDIDYLITVCYRMFYHSTFCLY